MLYFLDIRRYLVPGLASTYGILASAVQPSSMVHPHVVSFPTMVTIPPITLTLVMSSGDQTWLERFIWLDPPIFSCAIGEDVYVFLLNCQERLHNLRSLKCYGVTYTTY